MIFSTFYRAKLFANNKPCFIVNPIMTPNEKNILIQKVHLLVNRRNALSLSSVINVVQKYVSDKNILDDIYNGDRKIVCVRMNISLILFP